MGSFRRGIRFFRSQDVIFESRPIFGKNAPYNPRGKKRHFGIVGDDFGKFWEGFRSVLGRWLGNVLGHVWKVFDGSSNGF